ncbi:MAG TPA: glycosyltransferase family 2 protein [Pseudomonadales bacterium]|nr:glycosyltransferase family 2 protein [Pseudomonadales bacterium]
MVTIGIPIFNAESTLAETIQSVLAQTSSNWELILIDDGSTDNSLSIAMAMAMHDPRIRVIADGVNRGLPTRLNQIVEEAKYDLVMRMDADDLMHPERLEKQLKVLQDDSSIDLVCTGLYSVTNQLDLRGSRNSIVPQPLTLIDVVFGRCQIVHASILVRKQWYLRNRYNPASKRIEDYELFVTAASRNDLRVRALDEYLYVYREEGNVHFSKLKQVYLSKFRFITLNRQLNIPVWLRLRFGFVQLSKLLIAYVLHLLKLNRLMLMLRGNSPVSPRLQKDLSEILGKIRRASHEA